MTWQNMGSSGGSHDAWLAAAGAFVAAKDATLTKINFWSPCTSLFGIDRAPVTGTTGESELVRVAGSTEARIRLASGTGANSYRITRNRTYAVSGTTSAFDQLCANARTSHWAVCTRVIVNAVNATASMQLASMTDEATQSVYVGVEGATSQANFSLKIGSAAIQDVTVAIGTLGIDAHDIYMMCDGTTISVYMDGNTTASVTGLSNTGANAAAHSALLTNNGATASNVGADILNWAAFGA